MLQKFLLGSSSEGRLTSDTPSDSNLCYLDYAEHNVPSGHVHGCTITLGHVARNIVHYDAAQRCASLDEPFGRRFLAGSTYELFFGAHPGIPQPELCVHRHSVLVKKKRDAVADERERSRQNIVPAVCL